jgi:hypothetical protein
LKGGIEIARNAVGFITAKVKLERFYQIKAGFEEDEGAIRKALLRRGRFIVATNELDSEIENEDRIVAW